MSFWVLDQVFLSNTNNLIDRLILSACQPVYGYFMHRCLGIAYIVFIYIFCVVSWVLFLHTVTWYKVFLSNTNNLRRDLFDP